MTSSTGCTLVIVPGGYYLEFPDGERVGRLDGSPFATLAEARDAMDHIENMQRMQASTPS